MRNLNGFGTNTTIYTLFVIGNQTNTGYLSLSGQTNRLTVAGGALLLDGAPIGGDTIWTNDGTTIHPIPATNFFLEIRPSGSLMAGTNSSDYFDANFDPNVDEPLFFNFRDVGAGDRNKGLIYSEVTDSASFNAGGAWETRIQTNFVQSLLTTYDATTTSQLSIRCDNASAQFPGASIRGEVNGKGWLFIPHAAATNTPYRFDTSQTHSSGSLLTLANNGTNKFTVDYAGAAAAQGGIASFSTVASVAIDATGWTNIWSTNNAVVVFGGTTVSSFKKRAGALTATNITYPVFTGNSTVILQPGQALVISGTSVTGSADPF